jgi:hypothetical protein
MGRGGDKLERLCRRKKGRGRHRQGIEWEGD